MHQVASTTGAVPEVPDELYTSFADIVCCMEHYCHYFKGKSVLCNCDDPFESKFFQFFALHFHALRLKKLVTTSYVPSRVAQSDLPLFDPPEKYRQYAYYIELSDAFAEKFSASPVDLGTIKRFLKYTRNKFLSLSSNGDFGSYESMGILDCADIVVTHPPASLFPKYLKLLLNYQKEFLIIGDKRLTAHPKIAAMMQQNRLHIAPESCRLNYFKNCSSDCCTSYPAVNSVWFTNLPQP